MTSINTLKSCMANIFFDLDGTLVDSRQRLYSLFCDLTLQNKLSFDKYWELKRDMKDHSWILTNILGYYGQQVEAFQDQWLNRIEIASYIDLDKLFDYTIPTMEELKNRDNNLYVVTARQSQQMAERQLENLGLMPYLTDFLVTQGGHSKAELVRRSVTSISVTDYFVGDTGMDIMAGKELGVKSVAVLSGFRDRVNLEKYYPDYLFENIKELATIL